MPAVPRRSAGTAGDRSLTPLLIPLQIPSEARPASNWINRMAVAVKKGGLDTAVWLNRRSVVSSRGSRVKHSAGSAPGKRQYRQRHATCQTSSAAQHNRATG